MVAEVGRDVRVVELSTPVGSVVMLPPVRVVETMLMLLKDDKEAEKHIRSEQPYG